MAQKRVLVLGSTSASPWGEDQLVRLSAQARRRGLTLVGAASAAGLASASPQLLSLVDETVALDVTNPDACRDWARATNLDIDAVLTIHELSVLPASVIAHELGLPGNDPDIVHGIRTKDICRERLRAAGFAQPRVAVCESRADAEEFMRDNLGPWIVKPRDGLASTGVTQVRRLAELSDALAALGNLAESLRKFGAGSSVPDTPPPFLIETFVSGAEYSAEGVVVGGVPQVLAITAKRTNSGFIETGHRVSPDLSPELADAAATVARAITAAGVTHGAFHVEFWSTARGIVLGEIHARPGGDYVHALVEYSRPGLELYGMLLDDLLGLPQSPVPPQTRAAGTDFLLLPPGRVRSVHGWDDIAADRQVLDSALWVKAGDELGGFTDNLDRHGMIVAGTDEPSRLEDVLTELRARLVVDLSQVRDLAA